MPPLSTGGVASDNPTINNATTASAANMTAPVTDASRPAVPGVAVNKRPTDLVEVCRHLPRDVFEIRPYRAFLAAAQVRISSTQSLGWVP